MRILFACSTYFHVLNAVLRTMKEDLDADLFIFVIGGTSVDEFENLYERLNESKVFHQVYLERTLPESITIFEKIFWRYGIFQNRVKKLLQFNPKDYDEVYVYYDNDWVARYLKEKKIHYHIAEDGMNFAKKERLYPATTFWFMQKWRFYRLRRILRIGQMKSYKYYTDSRFVKTIEVNDKKDIVFQDDGRIVEKPQKNLLNHLEKAQEEKVLNIFLDDRDIIKGNHIALVLTQPFMEDGQISSLGEQLKIYEDLTQTLDGYQVIIKPHPRDATDYHSIKEAKILKRNFPSELIPFIDDGRIKKYVTIGSTAIEGFPKEKVIYYSTVRDFYQHFTQDNINTGEIKSELI